MKMNEMFLDYTSPVVEVINVQVEKGFAGSGINAGDGPSGGTGAIDPLG